jgi:predicted nucleic acid-binding Zn ribbon protein
VQKDNRAGRQAVSPVQCPQCKAQAPAAAQVCPQCKGRLGHNRRAPGQRPGLIIWQAAGLLVLLVALIVGLYRIEAGAFLILLGSALYMFSR